MFKINWSRKRSRVFSSYLFLVLFISLNFSFPDSSRQAFALSDISGYAYETAIEFLEDNSVIQGYPDGTFKPIASINRAELMKILVKSVVEEDEYANMEECFPDVKTEWFAPYVCYAESKGWVSGYPDGYFRPGNPVNKVEAIKMLINSYRVEVDANVNEKPYVDIPADVWFSPYIKTAKDNNLLVTSGSYFYPAASMTRGEISESLYRTIIDENVGGRTIISVSSGSSSGGGSGSDGGGGSGGGSGSDGSGGGSDSESSTIDNGNDTDPGSSVLDSEDPIENLYIWANEGGDKVTKDELRAAEDSDSVTNSVWDGGGVSIFGAKNEVVNFDLFLEAPSQKIDDLEIEFDELTGPNGYKISTDGSDLFDWTDRDIEMFFVKYLEIKGLSVFMSLTYDERHLPEDLQAPHDSSGISQGGWYDRPNHNKLYPDIAVPLELEQGFDIPKNENQSVWVDIYIPKTAPAGDYSGTLKVFNNEGEFDVPIELEVLDFTLPDVPASKTMVVLGYGDLNSRYFGEKWPSGIDDEINDLRDKYFMLAHRHKISLIDDGDSHTEDRPQDVWIPRLDGSLFSSSNGYAGPGKNVGNGIYSIGLYGSWGWQDEGITGMQQHATNWESWFQNNFPNVEHFLYLIDESPDLAQIQEWASWIEQTEGIGSQLPSMATTWFIDAVNEIPSLDIPTSGMYVADKNPAQNAADYYNSRDDKKLYFYNGGRPGQGSFMIDDDGIALRELAWGQYKMDIDRWFYWNSTYYNNYQAGLGETNIFEQAHTFGGGGSFDSSKGETGWNYSNGDGVLFYPGTDMVYPSESYGIDGPIASLRLKYWRRGIQDIDYLVMAMKKNSSATWKIINETVPKVLWEYGVNDPNDPTWVRTDISWSNDPDDWEEARRDLADVILGN